MSQSFSTNLNENDNEFINYSKQINLFKSLSDNKKTIFFKSLVDSFSISNGTKFKHECLYKKNSYQIKLIDDVFKTIENGLKDSLLVECKIVYAHYLMFLGDKLSMGPFGSDSINDKIEIEIKYLSKSMRFYDEAIDILKSIENWEKMEICDTLINIEIIKCTLYVKIGIAFSRSDPTKPMDFNDSIHVDRIDYPDKAGIINSNDCLKRILSGYSKTECLSDDLKNKIMNKIKDIQLKDLYK